VRSEKVLIVVSLLLGLGLTPFSAVASVSPQHLALSFILTEMMNEQGGIYTQYRALPSSEEGAAAGHEVLLQNNSLLMLYAARTGDQQLLDQQVEVIKDYFLEENLGLLHWKLAPTMQPSESSWGTYSNSPGDSLRVA